MPSSYRRRERHVCVFRSTHHRLKLFSTFRNEDIYQNVLQIIGFSVNLVKSLRSNDPEADKKKNETRLNTVENSIISVG